MSSCESLDHQDSCTIQNDTRSVGRLFINDHYWYIFQGFLELKDYLLVSLSQKRRSLVLGSYIHNKIEFDTS